MAKNSRGKRPCSICRKWFTPDVRQKGRQKTCSPAWNVIEGNVKSETGKTKLFAKIITWQKSLKKLSNKHPGAFLRFHIKNKKSRFCQWKSL